MQPVRQTALSSARAGSRPMALDALKTACVHFEEIEKVFFSGACAE
jgi:hypothetical protein